MIADEIFRGRYRTNPASPAAIPANTPEEYKFSLHAADHVFLKGHRIMVQVQSSWFPLYDLNAQTFVPTHDCAAVRLQVRRAAHLCRLTPLAADAAVSHLPTSTNAPQ